MARWLLLPAGMTQQQRSEPSGFCLDQNLASDGVGNANGQTVHMKSNGIPPLFPGSVPPLTAGRDGSPPEMSREHRILLVEDDPDTRACMSSLLELEGYFVVTAADGREALQRLRSGLNPTLIVLDLMRPGMDGFEFRKEQLQDPMLSTVPVVVYSGHHDAKANLALLEPAGYIQKPINFDSFLDMVSAHCGHVQTPARTATPEGAPATAPDYA